MSKIAFIFPGQGAQACGMGKDFYEQTETGKRIFDKATQLMGFSMPQLCFEENDIFFIPIADGDTLNLRSISIR